MKLDVYSMAGKKVDSVEVPADIFEAPVRVDLMHQAFVRQMANARLGTHQTKSRSFVSGGGRKPFRQKGTGRARQGSTRAAQWVGGGKIHTPHPRDYSKKMPKKMRQAALRSALSAKAGEEALILVDKMELKEAKTKLMAQALNKLAGENSVLILMSSNDEGYEMITRSARNLAGAKTLEVGYLNIRDLLKYDRIMMPVSAIEAIQAHLG
jgi:large subunit ribosomal protein L4